MLWQTRSSHSRSCCRLAYTWQTVRKLWHEVFQLLRDHKILWLPALSTGVVVYLLGLLRRSVAWRITHAVTHWTEPHSVFGPPQRWHIPSTPYTAVVISKAFELSLQFLDLTFFFIALFVTANMIEEIQRTGTGDLRNSLRLPLRSMKYAVLLSGVVLVVGEIVSWFYIPLRPLLVWKDGYLYLKSKEVSLWAILLLIECGLKSYLAAPLAIKALLPPRQTANPGSMTLARRWYFAAVSINAEIAFLLSCAVTLSWLDIATLTTYYYPTRALLAALLYAPFFVGLPLLALRQKVQEAEIIGTSNEIG